MFYKIDKIGLTVGLTREKQTLFFNANRSDLRSDQFTHLT